MDRRIAKTQKALVEALGHCLTKHPWEDVSVQLLCDTADVSRSAFYAHFDGKQDLLNLAMEAMVSKLVADSNERRGLRLNGKINILPALLRHMRDHLFLFETTRASIPGLALAHHFETMIGKNIQAEIAASQFSGSMTDRKVKFLIGGLFAVLHDWRDRQCIEPDEDVLAELDQVADLVFNGKGD